MAAHRPGAAALVLASGQFADKQQTGGRFEAMPAEVARDREAQTRQWAGQARKRDAQERRWDERISAWEKQRAEVWAEEVWAEFRRIHEEHRKANRPVVISPMIDARAKKVADKLGIETYGDPLDVESL